ncbi:MAG: TonB-dependent receptor domain-containing protein, partial [Brevundimonas sp.]
GDPAVESQSLWFNAGKPINAAWEAYAFGGIQHKESESGATARAYNNANNVLAIYPDGFLPLINTEIVDYNLYGGLKGEAAGIDWDVSVGYGRNVLDYRVTNSLNASYGAASQQEFDAGGLKYDQLTLGIDGVRPLEFGLIEPVNLAFGLEYRTESFEVYAGEPASYNRGTGGTATAALGSQGFPGFSPANAADEDRNNWSAYIDLEGKLTQGLTVGVAGRYEDYSDFGDQVTGKISARYDFSPAFALRGAVSTGFHAPALQQQFFSYTATNLITTTAGTALIQAGTFRVDDPIAISLGSRPLEPETSVNYSIGGVFRAAGLELTIDAYRIELDDRIVYSENLGGTGARLGQNADQAKTISDQLQAAYGVSAARFFLNGVNTVTEGVDVVGRYRLPTDYGRFDFTLAGNFNNTEVTATPTPAAGAPSTSEFFLFDRANILAFEEGTPGTKVVGGVDWSMGGFGVSAKATYYESVLVANNSSTLDYETGDKTLIDLEGRYQFPAGVGLAVGVNNLFDEYPEYTPTANNGTTGSVGFPSYSPFGFNGRFLYARLSYSF